MDCKLKLDYTQSKCYGVLIVCSNENGVIAMKRAMCHFMRINHITVTYIRRKPARGMYKEGFGGLCNYMSY